MGPAKILCNDTGDPQLAEAAMKALNQVTWEPALQKDKPVAMWISIPFKFKLGDGEK